jgi:hypothetical protein
LRNVKRFRFKHMEEDRIAGLKPDSGDYWKNIRKRGFLAVFHLGARCEVE